MKQKLIELNNFLFSVRKGFFWNLTSYLASFAVSDAYFNGGEANWYRFIAMFAVFYLCVSGFRHLGNFDKWDEKEYWNKL